MAVKPVLRLGDPRLLRTAREVTEFNTPALDALVEDMLDTMQAEDGAGLAAPQIGVDLRVVVFGFETSERYPECSPLPRTLLVNPVIKPLSDEQLAGWEGCLSVPGMRGVVSRYNRVQYSGLTPQGEAVEVVAEGFHARVVQHECDHLDGILYTQRLVDPTLFGFTEELAASGQLSSQ
ncbi:MAG TPA: peptide deformylase [Thiotrichales bacterium]|nr:peptide deformylase [Thiotrichales bacterium]